MNQTEYIKELHESNKKLELENFILAQMVIELTERLKEVLKEPQEKTVTPNEDVTV